MFGNPVYSLDGPGPSIAVSGLHEEFFNGDLGIWIGGKHSSEGFCIPIMMQEVGRALVLRQIRLEQLSILHQELSMRRAIVVIGKTFHVSPHDRTKAGVNKGISYTSTDAPGE